MSCSSKSVGLFILLVTVTIVFREVTAVERIVERSGSGERLERRPPSGRPSDPDRSILDDLNGPKNFDQLWNLMYEDLVRWLAIMEDVFAETIREQFFDGIVDRKTVKMAMRFFAQNAFITLQRRGLLSPDTFPEASRPVRPRDGHRTVRV